MNNMLASTYTDAESARLKAIDQGNARAFRKTREARLLKKDQQIVTEEVVPDDKSSMHDMQIKEVTSQWKFFKKQHTKEQKDGRSSQTTLTGTMLAKAMKHAKMFEQSSK